MSKRTNFEDVKAFHEKMGLPVGEHPQLLDPELMDQRMRFMREELEEIQETLDELEEKRWGEVSISRESYVAALATIFDGLMDLTYVAHGTAVMMGLPWDEGWDLVQAANMAKIRIEGRDDEHHRGVIKPLGWKHPDLRPLVVAAKVFEDGQP